MPLSMIFGRGSMLRVPLHTDPDTGHLDTRIIKGAVEAATARTNLTRLDASGSDDDT
ncbi:hypothetical protein PGTUg99_017231 [Puccinia graminis f. sp. tritici]|uniref:Uncharacterized protein n=1 Tax=Puccinia graminis f. sp. tritici TaxID=56615 RepID=A0A5B0MYK9_PUCGR|nr:hypothetical protein PGTUg99_017231 [Puccinia graminis f. sp. tritici]